ncbi:hypothetical protein [Streptomyces sp. NPDC047968]
MTGGSVPHSLSRSGRGNVQPAGRGSSCPRSGIRAAALIGYRWLASLLTA